MIRSKLVQRLAEKRRLGRLAAEAVFGAIMASLRSGERVEIRGFGTFSVRRYPGYRGRNPKTGASIEVKPKRLTHFKPGAELRAQVNRRPAMTAGRKSPPVAGARSAGEAAGSQGNSRAGAARLALLAGAPGRAY